MNRLLQGRGLSPGIAIGPCVSIYRDLGEIFRRQLPNDAVEAEQDRLRQAVRIMEVELARTRESVRTELGGDLAGIFDAHDLILHDALFLERILDKISGSKVNAEWAVRTIGQRLAEQFARIETAHLRERGQDVEDIVRYLIGILQRDSHQLEQLDVRGAIVVANELTPSEALRFGRNGAAGFVLEGGGEGSHTVIVARALSVPLILGLESAREILHEGTTVIIDADAGQVLLGPDDEEIEVAQLRLAEDEEERWGRLSGLAKTAGPDRTACGTDVELHSNIEILDEINLSLAARSCGVGLYRSEFLYIEAAPALPSEEQHVAAYERLLISHAPRPVTIRTFDLGGREIGQELREGEESNPALGQRGIRMTLAHLDIFRTQLRALLLAGRVGELRLMIPMVSSVDQVRRFREVLHEVRDQLTLETGEEITLPPLGIMIEVPAAALMAAELARYVDFFAIGTNDLTQYTLAVDRNNRAVSSLYSALHPAVLRLIEAVVLAAEKAGVEVSLCGELAGDPRSTHLLLGAGLRQLSVSPLVLPKVRSQVNCAEISGCRSLWRAALACNTAAEVDTLLPPAS